MARVRFANSAPNEGRKRETDEPNMSEVPLEQSLEKQGECSLTLYSWKLSCTAEPLRRKPPEGGTIPLRNRGCAHAHEEGSLDAAARLTPRRERERERLAQVLHLCLGACAAPLHRGGAGGLTWTVPPGEPSPFSQRCLSRTSDAVLFKAPLVATAG